MGCRFCGGSNNKALTLLSYKTPFLLAAICYDGNEGLYWVAITQFVIVILAAVMVTLRVGFKEAPDIPDEEPLDDELEVDSSADPSPASDALTESDQSKQGWFSRLRRK